MKKDALVHPFLFGLFPVIFLFSHNVKEATPEVLVLPIIVVTSFTLLVWAALAGLMRDWRKAGFVTSLFLIFFFLFGPIHRVTSGAAVGGIVVGTKGALLFIWAALFLALSAFLLERVRDFSAATVILNILGALLVALPLLNSAYWLAVLRDTPDAFAYEAKTTAERPDIYYIILDGYARSDVLKDVYGYDNGEFISFLRDKGFYVADDSRSNYAMTPLSIASSLNFTYLDALVAKVGDESNDARPLIEMIRGSGTARFLRSQGYRIAAFSTGYAYTELMDADIYMAPPLSLNEFENGLLNFTPLPPFLDMLSVRLQYYLHRGRIMYTLDNLASLPEGEAPVFVFAHIMAPHDPIVFGENGEPVQPEEEFHLGVSTRMTDRLRDAYIKGYRGQTAYMTNRAMKAVEDILNRRGGRPVIIIQSDHGPSANLDWMDADRTDFRERMSILYACYLPGGGQEALYGDITPVNTFRVVLDRYFGAGLPLLEDRSYFSTPARPYRFIDVTSRMEQPVAYAR